MGVGILSQGEVRETLCPRVAQTHHGLTRPSAKDVSIGPSAIDLPLGDKYWEMQGSCRAGVDLSVTDLIRCHATDKSPKTLGANTVLSKGNVYLVELDCSLDLEGTKIAGKATGRSSIGRLDVLVRLLGDRCDEFDRIPDNWKGDLYVEVAPISFNLIVSPGTCLNQLRLFRGREDLFTLTMGELEYEEPCPVIRTDGRPHPFGAETSHETIYPFSLNLTEDPGSGCYGFVAKKDVKEAIDPAKYEEYDPTDFWEPVRLAKNALVAESGRLYILRSKERLKLPAYLAIECQAYTETLGEWRIEYAGFAHPWFGSLRKDGNGTPIIFEVRGHNVPTILRDGLRLGNVSFRRMSNPADEPQEQKYENQELALAKCFKPWPK